MCSNVIWVKERLRCSEQKCMPVFFNLYLMAALHSFQMFHMQNKFVFLFFLTNVFMNCKNIVILYLCANPKLVLCVQLVFFRFVCLGPARTLDNYDRGEWELTLTFKWKLHFHFRPALFSHFLHPFLHTYKLQMSSAVRASKHCLQDGGLF